MLLKDKNILIAGAASGIGQVCAIHCSWEGANVLLLDKNRTGLEASLSLLNKTGNHKLIEIDICDLNLIENHLFNIPIHSFVYSVGISHTLPLKLVQPETLLSTFRINTFGFFDMCKALDSGINTLGNIVIINSVMGSVGEAAKMQYCSSKSANLAGIKSLALELAPIRVNSISPAMVDSELATILLDKLPSEAKSDLLKRHPMGLIDVNSVTALCIFLLSDLSKWMTGADITIDGGYLAQ
jgi:NAD(P)-dependent dehydrogenase (short-subunit alcohol dehydrogenase family)